MTNFIHNGRMGVLLFHHMMDW